MVHVFIINSFSGHSERAMDIREKLEKYKDLNYFVFNTLKAGEEEDIARKMCRYFKGERIRFYCCGGTGTLRNMINGISNLNATEVAYFPCGVNSDYVKCFGDNKTLFCNIDNLINGVIMPVDYIKTNHGVALNTCSMGMDSKIINTMNKYKDLEKFGLRIPYLMGLVSSITSSKFRKMRINIGKDSVTDDIAEFVIGNGRIIAGNMHISSTSDIDDGFCEYGIAVKGKKLVVIRVMLAMINKNASKIQKLVTTGKNSYFEVRSCDEKPIDMNLDGEIIQGDDFWRIEVIHRGLNLVVPEGVSSIGL